MSSAYILVQKAGDAGELTADGEKLKQMIQVLQKVEKGSIKSISVEGQNELEGLGERNFQYYSNVYKSGPALNVRVTKEVRTHQSANAFLKGFNKKLKDTLAPVDNIDDTNLLFYDLAPAYKEFENKVDEGPLKLSFDKSMHHDDINKNVAARFFKPELATMHHDDINKNVTRPVL